MKPPLRDPEKKNQAEFGSENGSLYGRHHKFVEAPLAMGYFKANKLELSESLFDYYLHDLRPNKSDYWIPEHHVDMIVDTGDVQSRISQGLNNIVTQAKSDPQVEVLREFTSPWMDAGPTESEDVKYGIGHFSVAVSGDTLIRKWPGGLYADITYIVYIWDYYNFDHKTWAWSRTAGGNKENAVNQLGNHMRKLEEYGMARSFVARRVGPCRKSHRKALTSDVARMPPVGAEADTRLLLSKLVVSYTVVA